MAALAVLAGLCQACVTGHVMDAGRRDERLLEVRAAWLDAERLYLHYTAEITTERGDRVGTRDRAAAIALDALAPHVQRTDELAVAWQPFDPRTAQHEGRLALALRVTGADGETPVRAAARLARTRNGHVPAPAAGNGGSSANGHDVVLPVVSASRPELLVLADEERHGAFLLHAGDRTWAVSTASLARGGTAPWVWTLVPLTVLFDALFTPTVPLFAAPLVGVGD